MVLSPAGLRPERDCATVNYRPVLSSERALQKMSRRKKIWPRVAGGCLTQRRTGQLTGGRNITLTLALTLLCHTRVSSRLEELRLEWFSRRVCPCL
jgi:hypothetical protein